MDVTRAVALVGMPLTAAVVSQGARSPALRALRDSPLGEEMRRRLPPYNPLGSATHFANVDACDFVVDLACGRAARPGGAR